jgi:SAM-dependent methyltransferase
MARSDHPLHSMSSYLGGFPPRVPRRLVERWTRPRATVLDPFCGSGTTLLEAKLLGRPSIGIDLNPLAVALSRAKLQAVRLRDLTDRLTSLAEGFRGEAEIDDVPDTLLPIFHVRTLAQLCYLRRALADDMPEDVFLRGSILGIMHGKHRRDGSTAYLSVDMPNTFSMSPEYVRRFVERNRLYQPPVDVFSKLRERVAWLLRSNALPEAPHGDALQGDAGKLDELLSRLGVLSVGAIVTSPPYLGILRYGAFNWIRLWFLGYDQYAIDRLLQTTDSLEVYLSFMASFLTAAGRVLKPGGVAALVIGDVAENGQHVFLAERVWEELRGVVPFELVEVSVDAYDEAAKTTRVWGEERKGRASPTDRVVVLRRAAVRRKGVVHRPSRSASRQRRAADGAVDIVAKPS